MPAKKRTTRKDTTAAKSPAEIEGASKVAKPATTRPQKAAAATPDTKAVTAKAANEAQPKATKVAKPRTRKVAPVEVAVPVAGAAEVSVAADTVTDAEVVTPPAISVDDIRRAAYLLSLRRHGPSDPVADWFEAERLLGARA